MSVVFAKINLDNLKQNFLNLKKFVGDDIKFCALIKANAYGHGSVEIAKSYAEFGADYLAVARVNEGEELRKNGINLPILLLGYSDEVKKALLNNLELCVFNYEYATTINEIAKSLNLKAKIHIKLDTGMARLGFVVRDEKSILEATLICLKISKLSNIEIVGVFTHFAKSDSADKSFTNLQLKRFNAQIYDFEKNGLKIPLKHVSNSAAILDTQTANLNMVRSGIVGFGFYPSDEVKKSVDLKPVMSLYAMISNIKILKPNTPISYGGIYTTKDYEKIVTICIGYGDGFLREQNNPEVLINNVKCPVVGRICMDQCMVKVPFDMEVKVGEYATIFNEDDFNASNLARRCNTISYEILSLVASRVKRIYYKNGKIID
ncbi:alanine racemase [Campylobacter ureolyticus]|uniref:alanine racemase n=1 Tax=Campylobacter ureolyticus TaxID=827 RepID=UPI00046B03F6|nr:alanine racemase [Campylobacter ureolyticus]QIX86858.1 alanine racemase [Campylobacter ureolyticus]STA70839.1 alanine racemase [Campylobacter ureolyticus]